MEHLPECPMLEGCHYWSEVATEAVIDDEHRGNVDDYCPRCGTKCICELLRACEQRVLAKRYVDSCPACWAGAHDACYSSEKCGCRTCEYDRGRAAGLDAARDAVAAAQADAGDINFCKDCADWSVAAIDALHTIRTPDGERGSVVPDPLRGEA